MLTDKSANIVLLSPEWNPSAFQQLWFLENGILERDEFGPETAFTPIAINIDAPRFTLLILPQRTQFTFKKVEAAKEGDALVKRVVGGFIKHTSTTSFLAIGLNFGFGWEVPSNEAGKLLSRHLCIRDDNPFVKEFDDPTARFGLMLKKDAMDSKMTLRITPISRETVEGFSCQVNFHHPVTAGIEDAQKFLSKWKDAMDYARTLSGRLDQMAKQHA